jgi:hypothetical protein
MTLRSTPASRSSSSEIAGKSRHERAALNPLALLPIVIAASIPLAGCIGFGDLFAEKHSLAGDYYLMQREVSPSDVYLFVGHESTSIAGPLHQNWVESGLHPFTNGNRLQAWNLINVNGHRITTITEAQEPLTNSQAIRSNRIDKQKVCF